jgi:hypothetical protein
MLKIACLSLGLVLLVLNISSVLWPPKNNNLGKVKVENSGIFLEQNSVHKFQRAAEQSTASEQIQYVNNLVYSTVIHSNLQGTPNHCSFLIRENYLIYLLHFLPARTFSNYEFVNGKTAINKGSGYCSQMAMINAYFLNQLNIKSYPINLKAHVACLSIVGKDSFISDSDFGVFIPIHSKTTCNEVENIYKSSPIIIMESDKADQVPDIVNCNGNTVSIEKYRYHNMRTYLEVFVYWLKWLLPMVLILQFKWNAKAKQILLLFAVMAFILIIKDYYFLF